MNIGAHKSISGGLDKFIERQKEIGSTSAQLFVTPPRNWNETKFSKENFAEFGQDLAKNNLGPNFLHGIYLVNLHTENPETREKGIKSVVSYLEIANHMKAKGVIIHSHRPDNNFISAIDEILENSPTDPYLIIEHSAICTIEETLALFTKGNSRRLALCLDTCHLFAAGYNICDRNVIEDILEKIDKAIGLDKLIVIHTNDCKSKLGSKRDIHENIGQGNIGIEAFRTLINHPKLKNLPFILETPGFDRKGPDKQNIDILRGLING